MSSKNIGILNKFLQEGWKIIEISIELDNVKKEEHVGVTLEKK